MFKSFFTVFVISFLLYTLVLIPSVEAAELMHCNGPQACWFYQYGKQMRVSLWGIDTPPKDEPEGQAVIQYLNQKLEGRQVELMCRTPRSNIFHQRCSVWLNGEDIAAHLVLNGFAWDKTKESKGHYLPLEKEAQVHHYGRWHIQRKPQ